MWNPTLEGLDQFTYPVLPSLSKPNDLFNAVNDSNQALSFTYVGQFSRTNA